MPILLKQGYFELRLLWCLLPECCLVREHGAEIALVRDLYRAAGGTPLVCT